MSAIPEDARTRHDREVREARREERRILTWELVALGVVVVFVFVRQVWLLG